MYYLGIDVGGTTIKAGLVDESGQLGEARKIPTIVADLTLFLTTLTELIVEFQKSASIAAIGLGVPGLVRAQSRTIETSPNIPCLRHISLDALLANQVHLPVIVENDANAGSYGETICGAARGRQHVAYLTLGTGLGCGLVLNGRIFRGTSGFAGEFGHTTVEPAGRLCTCGNRGCLEAYVSGTGMVRTAQELLKGSPAPLTAKAIYEAAIRGDGPALETFQITSRYLGVACANLINLLNPEALVIGGGVMASGDLLLNPAVEEAGARAFPESFRDCTIVQSQLWPDAGLIGAAMLARDR